MLNFSKIYFNAESNFYQVHSLHALYYCPQLATLMHPNCIHLFTFPPPVRKSNVVVIFSKMHRSTSKEKKSFIVKVQVKEINKYFNVKNESYVSDGILHHSC